MTNKDKIPAVMVSNIHLRKALVEAVKQSNHKIDEEYIGIEKINHPKYVSFVLNDFKNNGAGFSPFDVTDKEFEFILIDRMFEILAKPAFVPVEVKLNDDYVAMIQEDGSVRVGCQTFAKDVICKLLYEIEKVQAKQKS